MKSRLVLAVIVAALVAAVLGYQYGKIRQQAEETLGYAAGQRVPVPDQPGEVGPMAAVCVEPIAAVTFHPADSGARAKVTVSRKPLPVRYPTSDVSVWAICWDLDVAGDDPRPLERLELKWTSNNVGEHGQPVLQCAPASCSFLPSGRLMTLFKDNPKGPRPAPGNVWQVIGYELDGQLSPAQGGGPVQTDPEIVIKG